MEHVYVHLTILDQLVNTVIILEKKPKLKYSTFVYLIENPCIHQNQCLNSGTCIGQYNPSEILSAQCICLPGFTGNICEGKTIQDIK